MDELRVKLRQAEELYESNEKKYQDWLVEKEDLSELRDHLQKELSSYMSLNSDLKIHKENMELEFSDKLKRNEEMLLSNSLQIQEKENQVGHDLGRPTPKLFSQFADYFLCFLSDKRLESQDK